MLVCYLNIITRVILKKVAVAISPLIGECDMQLKKKLFLLILLTVSDAFAEHESSMGNTNKELKRPKRMINGGVFGLLNAVNSGTQLANSLSGMLGAFRNVGQSLKFRKGKIYPNK